MGKRAMMMRVSNLRRRRNGSLIAYVGKREKTTMMERR